MRPNKDFAATLAGTGRSEILLSSLGYVDSNERMDNHEVFDRVAAGIFARLYTSFPAPINIDVAAVAKAAGVAVKMSERQETFPKSSRAENIGRWLEKQGYLEFQMCEACWIHGPVLTMKGLQVLRLKPSNCGANGRTWGEIFADPDGPLVRPGIEAILNIGALEVELAARRSLAEGIPSPHSDGDKEKGGSTGPTRCG
jgi:hypothetical protein